MDRLSAPGIVVAVWVTIAMLIWTYEWLTENDE